jgi:hypothetical protein
MLSALRRLEARLQFTPDYSTNVLILQVYLSTDYVWGMGLRRSGSALNWFDLFVGYARNGILRVAQNDNGGGGQRVGRSGWGERADTVVRPYDWVGRERGRARGPAPTEDRGLVWGLLLGEGEARLAPTNWGMVEEEGQGSQALARRRSTPKRPRRTR